MKCRLAGHNVDGAAIIGLFGNSHGDSLFLYGPNLYGFTLNNDAKIMRLSNKMYCLMRHNKAYRGGLFDSALRLGFSAIARKHEGGDTSIVVLNFKSIKSWSIVNA